MKFEQKNALPLLAVGFIASFFAVSMASAQTVRIGNQGDALSLDPHSLNESLQLSVTGNVYDMMPFRYMSVK